IDVESVYYRLKNHRGLLGLSVAARCYGVKILPSGEKITLPGQVYEEEHYKRICFVGCQKGVNEKFAIDLIVERAVTKVERALGHPKAYRNLDKETKTGTCGYCGLQVKHHHHH
uniref:Zinc finger CHCC-type domain-containing protein n=1 Tax=Vombatus ursinus TaxID=29139 RepID=A0A4X2LGH7_VOMUR